MACDPALQRPSATPLHSLLLGKVSTTFRSSPGSLPSSPPPLPSSTDPEPPAGSLSTFADPSIPDFFSTPFRPLQDRPAQPAHTFLPSPSFTISSLARPVIYCVWYYFATSHYSWERGTNENTNGLIRQYLPKRQTMAKLTQAQCDQIALQINRRPRKRLNIKNPYDSFFN